MPLRQKCRDTYIPVRLGLPTETGTRAVASIAHTFAQSTHTRDKYQFAIKIRFMIRDQACMSRVYVNGNMTRRSICSQALRSGHFFPNMPQK